MSGKRVSKRKRGDASESESKDIEPHATAMAQGPTGTRFLKWIDDGVKAEDGITEHESFSIDVDGKIIDVYLGDTVLMRNETSENDSEDEYFHKRRPENDTVCMVARVESIWEVEESPSSKSAPRGRKMFRARWFLQPEDVKALPVDFSGPESYDEFANRLTASDLVITNQMDDNEVTTIVGDPLVIYRRPQDDEAMPQLPPDTFVCRYSVSFGADDVEHGVVQISPFLGENDSWRDFISSDGKRRKHIEQNQIILHPSGAQQDLPQAGEFHPSAGFHEGKIEQRDIRVGSEHQVSVPNFRKNLQSSSRNPVPVWKHDEVTASEINEFVSSASRVLVPFIKMNSLTHLEPYSPLGWREMEELGKEMNNQLPTLSTICTASSLSTRRTDMLREVDIDALMKLLHDMKYDVGKALVMIEKNPANFVCVWAPPEKQIVNAAFRRYAGSIRMVHKALSSEKTFHDVIDYIYRFKIPDQFRVFQNEKRERAIRMVEYMETRRSVNANINLNREVSSFDDLSRHRQTQQVDWYKRSVSDVTGAVASRRVEAKKVLTDVQERLGKEKFVELSNFIKKFEDSPEEARDGVMSSLREHQDLLNRVLAFFSSEAIRG